MDINFNLITDGWIKTNKGVVGLLELLSSDEIEVYGNFLEKASLYKFVIGLAQGVLPLKNDQINRANIPHLKAELCGYLKSNLGKFNLYGKNAFLQIDNIDEFNPRKENSGVLMLHIPGNNSPVFQYNQLVRKLSDSEKAISLIVFQNFSFGGKRYSNYKKESDSFVKISGTPKSAPSIGQNGLLHVFIEGKSVLETIMLNYIGLESLESLKYFEGAGVFPWDVSITNREDFYDSFTKTFIGRLIPLSRFVKFTDDGDVLIANGFNYPSFKEGVVDPSSYIGMSKGKFITIKASTNENSWKSVMSMLKTFNNEQSVSCVYANNISRSPLISDKINVISGGIAVSESMGEVCMKIGDDVVSSSFAFSTSYFNELFFEKMSVYLSVLGAISAKLRTSVFMFHKDFFEKEVDTSLVLNSFWCFVEKDFINLFLEYLSGVNNFKKVEDIAIICYNKACSDNSPAGLFFKAKNIPNFC